MEWIPELDNITAWICFGIFLFMAFIQLFWTLYFYLRIAFHKHKHSENKPPVSVIIAARNEEDNLFKLLPRVLNQEYPEFEVIVVNHQSSDDSSHILKALARENKHLKIIELERNKHLRSGKKLPLTIAIKGAKYEHLLFTDADCKPATVNWISLMVEQFSTKKEIVLGYGPYRKTPGLLNRIIRLDTAMVALNYLSFAKGKVPYMGVGRNMGYTRSLFLKNDGFKSHYSIQSGDDDLFVQEAARKRNYSVCIHPHTFCYSEGEKKWSDWFKQKSRHYTTTERYRVIKKLLLGIYPLSLILLYTSFVTLYLLGGLSWTALSTLGFIVLLKWFIQGKALIKLSEKGFIWALPVWDLFYVLFTPIVYYTTDKSIDKKWK